MDNTTLQRINDLLSKNDKVGIVVGANPTLDQMGAALSLYLSLSEIGKSTSIASVTEPIVAISNLVGIDKVKSTLEGDGGDLIVSFPYNEGEIEKVSYTLEEGFLNIVVKAGEQGLAFAEQDVKYRRSGGVPSLVFTIGVPSMQVVDQIVTPREGGEFPTIVNIDNSARNEGYGDVVMVVPDASSVSEQIGQLISMLDLPLDADMAQNLMSGTSDATQNFQSPNTSYLAFEMAALFMKRGAHRITTPTNPQVHQQLSNQLPRPQQQHQQPRRQQYPNQGQNQQRGQQNPQRQQQQNRPQGQSQQNIQGNSQNPQRQQQQNAEPDQNALQQRIQQHQEELRRLSRERQQNQPQQNNQQSGGRSFPQQNQPQVQEPADPHQVQPAPEDQDAPSDWLEPKVYKGSTPL